MFIVLGECDVVTGTYNYDDLSRVPKAIHSKFIPSELPERHVGAWFNRETGEFVFQPEYDQAYQRVEWNEELKRWEIIDFQEKPPDPVPEIDQLRADKKQAIGAACTATIYAGVEVGGNRYSLTEHDQTEIMVQLQTVKEGAAAVPYHADGELCRMYPAAEFIGIAKAATEYVFYHRTYCNHVNKWIERADYDELAAITYGAELPPDLAEHMAGILAAMGGNTDG